VHTAPECQAQTYSQDLRSYDLIGKPARVILRFLEDAERLIAAWNERQAKRMPTLFSPTIGAAVAAGYWLLWVRCPACRTTGSRSKIRMRQR
jgi:hypothetical protein